MTASWKFLGWEVPSHSDDIPTLVEGCAISNGCGKMAVGSWTKQTKKQIKKKQKTHRHRVLLFKYTAVAIAAIKQVMVYSLSSVARMNDCRVLSGRGGVGLRSAAQSNTTNRKLLHFLLGNSYLIHCFACKCFTLKQDLKANIKARSYLWQAVGEIAAPQTESKYSLKKGQDHLLVLQYKKAMLYKSSQCTCRNILLIVRIYENVKFNFFYHCRILYRYSLLRC